jgi:hypothetical protein
MPCIRKHKAYIKGMSEENDGDSMEPLRYERINGKRKRRKHKFKLSKHTFEFALHMECQNQKRSFYKHIFVNKTTEI